MHAFAVKPRAFAATVSARSAASSPSARQGPSIGPGSPAAAASSTRALRAWSSSRPSGPGVTPSSAAEVHDAEHDRDHAGMRRDVERGAQPAGGLDQRDDGRPAGVERVDRPQRGGLGLRHHDRVEGEAVERGEVGRGVRRVEAVDAHEQRAVRPRRAEMLGDDRAGGGLGLGRDGVLEVDDHRVRRARQGLGDPLGLARGDEQVGADAVEGHVSSCAASRARAGPGRRGRGCC